jgi:AAA+ superfamily predicted ATPase
MGQKSHILDYNPAMEDVQRLSSMFAAQHACVSIATTEEADALELARRVALEQGVDFWMWSVTGGVRDGLLAERPAAPDTDHPAAALLYLSTNPRRSVVALLDLAGYLKDDRTLRLCRDLIEHTAKLRGMLVLIDGQGELPSVIRASSTPFDLSLPDEAELEQIVKATLRKMNELAPIKVEIDRRGFQMILRNLRGLTARQARQVILDTIATDRRFDATDVNTVLAEKRKAFQAAGLLDYVEAPVDLSSIGGLSRLKTWLSDRRTSLSEEAMAFGLPAPRGLLMLGVQGAGKSLSAKAVATSWGRPLLRLDVGALYDKYIGESERRLRDALRQADMMAPIVLWIDEIEKGFASAASQSTDGGLSKRMFGSLLTWMQEREAPVFVIATANDIEALPPELLRKGRFDEIFFVDLPSLEGRREIFAIHLRERNRDPERFDLDALADASDGFSGAEIQQAVIAGLHDAFAHGAELQTSHLQRAIEHSPPLSVTMAEKIEALRAWAAGRCVAAD